MNAQTRPIDIKRIQSEGSLAERLLLERLAENHGVTVSHLELEVLLYGEGTAPPKSNCVEVFIGRIRRRRLNYNETIITERGVGYRYEHVFA